MDIYSHILPGLQEEAALWFEDALEGIKVSMSTPVVRERNVGSLAFGDKYKVEFEAGRGVRVVYGAALEKRSRL